MGAGGIHPGLLAELLVKDNTPSAKDWEEK